MTHSRAGGSISFPLGSVWGAELLHTPQAAPCFERKSGIFGKCRGPCPHPFSSPALHSQIPPAAAGTGKSLQPKEHKLNQMELMLGWFQTVLTCRFLLCKERRSLGDGTFPTGVSLQLEGQAATAPPIQPPSLGLIPSPGLKVTPKLKNANKPTTSKCARLMKSLHKFSTLFFVINC